MKIKQIISMLNVFIRVKVLRQKIPFAVSWALTSRCNMQCQYCDIWNRDDDASHELSTDQILSVLDQLVLSGMKYISLTGGEPLLRSDIGKIINYLSSKGVYISISTNGLLINQKIEQIKKVDKLNISIDGPREVHDRVRGAGSYDKIIDSIETAQAAGIQVILCVTLSSYNLQSVDHILSLCQKYDVKVFFQPAIKFLLGSRKPNPVAPDPEIYRQTVQYLIKQKKGKKDYILNTVRGFKHIAYWPEPHKIPCAAGRVFFRITPNGTITNCARLYLRSPKPPQESNVISSNVKQAIQELKPDSCAFCWCASFVEYNLIWSFNLGSLLHMARNLVRKDKLF